MEKFNKQLKKNIQKIKNMIDYIPKSYIGIFFAIIVILSPLLDNKISYGHDYDFHMTNMILAENEINILKLDVLMPKIFGGNIAKSFGYGTGIFYPPLSYTLTSYLSYLYNSLNIDSNISITCIEILIVILSGIIMYKFINRIFKNNQIAAIGSISYISSTYFLCNIYIRTALAESLTYIFIPLVFWGLYELFYGDEKKFNSLFIIGYVGMIHSHLVITIYLTTIIIIIIFLCFWKKTFKKNIIKKIILYSFITLLISSHFLVPLLEHKTLGNYVVFENESMYTTETIIENTLTLKDFFKIDTIGYNGIKVFINPIILIIAIITIRYNKEIFIKEKRTIYIITMIITILSIIMSSSYFPWEDMPSFLKMIQFPWRICGFTSFGLSILAGNIVKIIKGENKQLIINFLVLSIIFLSFNNISLDRIWEPITISQMSLGWQNEYLPTKTQNNFAYFKNRDDNIIIKSGQAQIEIIENNTPYLKSKIVLNSDELTIELPRLYYLGYEIFLKDSNVNKKKIKYYENEYGFIELEVNESGILEIDYKGTPANKIANYISIITTTMCIILTICMNRKINKKRQTSK